jgi:hypothetical protein
MAVLVALEAVGLDGGPDTGAAIVVGGRGRVAAFLNAPAEEAEAEEVEKGSTKENLGGVALGVFEDEEVIGGDGEGSDDAEPGHEAGEEVLGDDVVEEIPEDGIHDSVEEAEEGDEDGYGAEGDLVGGEASESGAGGLVEPEAEAVRVAKGEG